MLVRRRFRRLVAAPLIGLALAAVAGFASMTYAAMPLTGRASAAAGVSTAADDGVRLDLITGGSEARSRVREQQVGRPPQETVASTRDVTGSIVLDPMGGVVPGESRITVDLRSLRSGDTARDNWAQREMLETHRFPAADFSPTAITGLPAPLPTEGEATFQMLGDFTLHGVTHPITWEVTAQFGEHEIVATAWTHIRLTEFDVRLPRMGPFLRVDEVMSLEIDFRAARTSGVVPDGSEAPQDTAAEELHAARLALPSRPVPY